MNFAKCASSTSCISYICIYTRDRVFSNFTIGTDSKGKTRTFLSLLPLLIKKLLLCHLFLSLLIGVFAIYRI